MAHLIDVAPVGHGRVGEVAALRPGGKGVIGAPLVDVVADECVHGHVEEAGLLKESRDVTVVRGYSDSGSSDNCLQ